MRRIRLGGGLLLTFLVAGAANGDGFFAPRIEEAGRAEQMVLSPRQEALLMVDDDRVRVVLRTHFRAGPKELAWIVPVPAKPTGIDKADTGLLAALDTETAPRFYVVYPGGRGHGCTCGVKTGDKQAMPSPVRVVETGQAGIFDYVVLTGTNADELGTWLNAHSYAVPEGARPIFERYVNAGWHWIAMRVRPELTDVPELAPHPVTYTYGDSALVYPLVISRLSADPKTEIVLYVLARSRYASANWANTTVEQLTSSGEKLHTSAGSPSGTNYEKLYLRAAQEQAGCLFVTEFAANIDTVGYRPMLGEINRAVGAETPGAPSYLTRLRAVVAPEAMDRDVTLVPVTGWPDVGSTHYLTASAPADEDRRLAAAATVSIVLVLSVGVWMLERTGRARAAGFILIAACCAALTML